MKIVSRFPGSQFVVFVTLNHSGWFMRKLRKLKRKQTNKQEVKAKELNQSYVLCSTKSDQTKLLNVLWISFHRRKPSS